MRGLFLIIFILTIGLLKAQDSIPKPSKTIGIASFYASKFNGRKTTSGQKFHNDSLTAAHKSLKFGTKVQVRNLKNDSLVVVTITDRLPKRSKRTIDLTQRAARQLNFMRSGLTKVEITVLDTIESQPAAITRE